MPVIVHLDLHIKPEALPAAHETIHEVLIATRAFDGNEGVDVLVDNDDPAHLVLVEVWQSMEHDAAYRAWRATPDGASPLGSLVASAPTHAYFTVAEGV